MATRLMLRVYFGDEAWLGPGKVELLEAVRDRGSISAAARAMGMSYRRAWLLIEHVNTLFREPAVQTTLGGTGGGAATLTAFGDELVTRYRRMEAVGRRAMRRDLAALEDAYRPAAERPASGTNDAAAAKKASRPAASRTVTPRKASSATSPGRSRADRS